MTTNFQTPAKQGVRARERNALERISELEANFGQFVQNCRSSFDANDKNVGELVEVATALKAIQSEKAEAEVAQGKAALAAKLEAGELVTGTVVTPDSVITGVERNADGTDVAPGYVQLEFATVKPEYQTKLLALSVGSKIDTENGRTFEVTGVYEPKKSATVTLAPAEAAATAQV
jgi:hypothetical protein